MAVIIFKLRNVPEEEAQAIRDLLDQQNISWYETSSGNWGISNPAIWLHNSDDKDQARKCIDDYQQQLLTLSQESETPDWISHIRSKPIAVLLAIIGIALIGYFSISPFFSLITS